MTARSRMLRSWGPRMSCLDHRMLPAASIHHFRCAMGLEGRHRGETANTCHCRKVQRPHDVWAYDFVSDPTIDGRSLKILALVDEFTREPLALFLVRSIQAKDILTLLRTLFTRRGAPKAIRSDNVLPEVSRKISKNRHPVAAISLRQNGKNPAASA